MRPLAAILVVTFTSLACSRTQPSAESKAQETPSAPARVASPRPAPSGDPLPLRLALSAYPSAQLSAKQLSTFQLEFTVDNVGSATVDPQLRSSSYLLINGKLAKDWDFTIANGPRDNRWQALPPRDQLIFSYGFGDGLFKGPGDYTLVFGVGSVQSPPLTVRVTP